jgi:hypothetical protein
LLLKIKVVMIGATRVENGLARWARVVARQVRCNAEGAFTIATVNSLVIEFGPGPNHGGMVGGFVVAFDAGVKGITALELDGNDVALGVIVGALGALIYSGAVADDRCCSFHFNESNRSTWSTPFTLLRR